MRKFLILSLACSSALAVNNGDTWAGSFQESNVTLNDGDSINVTLQETQTFKTIEEIILAIAVEQILNIRQIQAIQL